MQPESPAMTPLPTNQIDPALNLVRDELARRVGARNFEHWFGGGSKISATSNEVVVAVPGPFLLAWMQRQFASAVAEAARVAFGPDSRVRFQVDEPPSGVGTGASPCPTAGDAGQPACSRSTKPQRADQARAASAAKQPNERKFADLADFVEGPCNEMAMTAVRQVCAQPGARANPVFLHGPVGTGKSHLLEGTFKRLRAAHPTRKVMFLTAEQFANFFTEALREHKLPGFRRRFRSLDVLLIDDVDFLNGKKVIQEEFLHTVKQLECRGCQIVLTSDSHPRLLTKLSDELVTRFISGFVGRLEAPDAQVRAAIVQRRAKRMDADVSPEALEFVAAHFRNNVRELLGALNCLETWHHMTGKRVGITAARNVLAELERDCVRVVQLADVEDAVCKFFGMQPDSLRSARRDRSVAQPRMLAMYLARKHTRAAYREIGQHFGGRNHSTVVAAQRKVQDWLAQQTPFDVRSRQWSFCEVIEAIEHQLMIG